MANEHSPSREEMLRAQRDRETAAYYNPSLAAAIVERMGPGFAPTYDPRVKRFTQTDYQPALHGTFNHQSGEIRNYGPEPSASTFAHEYRHRAGVHDEMDNRIYDAMYAQTPEDWEQAVFMYQDRLNSERLDMDKPGVTREEAEADLLKRLGPWESEGGNRLHYLRREYQSAPEDQKPYPQDYEPDWIGFLAEKLGYGFPSEPQFVYGSRPPYEKAVAERNRRINPPPPPIPVVKSLGEVFTPMRR